MNKHASQPRAIYYVVALQIWEYFSFYGMRALLILYLTNQLKYNDTHAYELFSAYCSLVYVTPILGGFLIYVNSILFYFCMDYGSLVFVVVNV